MGQVTMEPPVKGAPGPPTPSERYVNALNAYKTVD